MLKIFRDRSIRSKLTLMTMLTTALALLVACAGFAVFDYFNYRQELVDQLNTHAAVVGGKLDGGVGICERDGCAADAGDAGGGKQH